MKNAFKWFVWMLETVFFSILILPLWLLPFKWASAVGAWLFQTIGVHLSVNRVARKNLAFVFPEYSEQKINEIIKGMWANMGRTFLEYLRLSQQDPFAPDSNYNILGIEHIDAMIQDQKPGLIMTIHQANWELGSFVAQRRGLKLAQVTRFLNNPIMRLIINGVHGSVAHEIIPKGTKGAKRMIQVLQQGGHVSMMTDQKLNEGMPIPFFGKDAMTAVAIAKLALRFDCPLVPVQVIRRQGIACDVIFHAPLKFPQEGTADDKVITIMGQVNALIEQWVRAHPEQWFWVHRRWPKAFYGVNK